MAIALDSAPGTNNNATATSLTYSHTCTGSNLFLAVSALCDNTTTVTGVTYATVAMAKTTASGVAVPGDTRLLYLWYLFAPSTGANNVVVSLGISAQVFSHSASFTGAPGTTLDAQNSASSASTTDLVGSITTVAANCWVIGAFRNSGAGNPTADSGTTARGVDSAGPTMDSNGPKSAGSNSLGASVSPAQGAQWLLLSISPGATKRQRHTLLYMGAG